jgi:hypothetical protein
LARIDAEGRIAVRVVRGVWTQPLKALPIALFRMLAPWQQNEIIEREFTINRGFLMLD